MDASFERTLEAARAGHRWALADLYRRLAPSVLGYLRGQGAREPEDVTSEVFVAMVRDLSRFRGDEQGFRGWIFTIAHRRLIDERRRLARRPEAPVDRSDLEGELDPGLDAEEAALARMGGVGVLEALDSLTPDQRDVILLRVVADLSVREAARLVGKPEGAVKALQRRGLLRLAQRISREGVT